MSTPVKKTLFLAGTPRASGDVQTGELPHIRAGGRAASIFSGAIFSGTTQSTASAPNSVPLSNAGELLLFSGPGRLNSVFPHTQLVSGLPVVFYDAVVLISGGPIPTSGHTLLSVLPGTFQGGAWSGLGIVTGAPYNGEPLRPETPFRNGLVVNCKSGQPGWTITYTPECSILDGGTITPAV